MEDVRRDGGAVRRRLFEALEDAGGLYGSVARSRETDDFLEDFYAKRLTLRLLLGQYKACRDEDDGPRDDGFYLRNCFDALDVNSDGVLDPQELLRARTLYEPRGATASSSRVATASSSSVCGLVDHEMSPFDVAVRARGHGRRGRVSQNHWVSLRSLESARRELPTRARRDASEA